MWKVFIFGFCFWKRNLDSLNVKEWKPERPVSKTVLFWNKFGLFVSSTYGFVKILKTCWSTIRPIKLQKLFMKVSSKETLKSPMKRNLSYLLMYSSIKALKELGWFEMDFPMGYMMRIRTISIFFSLKWSQTIYSQCNVVPVKLNGALNPSTLNWAEGNESSGFISESKIISTFLPHDIFQRIKSIP